MKTSNDLQRSILNKNTIWLWYGVVLLVSAAFGVFLYNPPAYQPFIISLLSFWTIVDALLFNVFHLGKNSKDSQIGAAFFSVNLASMDTYGSTNIYYCNRLYAWRINKSNIKTDSCKKECQLKLFAK